MKRSGFNSEVIDNLQDNLLKIQYNTLILSCHQVQKRSVDPEQRKMMQDMIDILTEKVQTLNTTHTYKKDEGHILRKEQAGGATQEQIIRLLNVLGLNDERIQEVLNSLTGKTTNDIRGLFATLDDNDIDYILREIEENDTIRGHVDNLRKIDDNLLTAMAEVGELDEDLKRSMGRLAEELLLLQINVIMLMCIPEEDETGITPKLDNILNELNRKFEALNELHSAKDEIMNDLSGKRKREINREERERREGGPILPSAAPTGEPGQTGEGLRQFGGANSNYYKMKYLKYKAKYMHLRGAQR